MPIRRTKGPSFLKNQQSDDSNKNKEVVQGSVETNDLNDFMESQGISDWGSDELKRMPNGNRRITIKQFKTKKAKRRLVVFGVIVAIVILFVSGVFKQAFLPSQANNPNLVRMPNYTGVESRLAVDYLQKMGLSVNVVPMYDQFTHTGLVIKSDVDPGALLEKGQRIKLFVGENNGRYEVSQKECKVSNTPEVKNNVIVEEFIVQNGEIQLLFKNDSNRLIKKMTLTLGFEDESGKGITSISYLDELNSVIFPGERFVAVHSMMIPEADKVIVDSINVEWADLPAKIRN